MIVNFLSCDEVPADYCAPFDPMISLDDVPLVEALKARGAEVRSINWNQISPRDIKGDLTLIRSCWNYHLAPDLFRDWVAEAEASTLPLLNTPDLVLRTMDKRYLLELQRGGISVVSTRTLEPELGATNYAEAFRSDRLIVKPVVGASSEGICVVGRDEEWPIHLVEAAASGTRFLVQPFMPEIRLGELSLIILDGKFSHVVRKVPAKGDFRVQYEFGGRNENASVSEEIVSNALRAASYFGDPLYARVDGVVVAGEFQLMELEMIEPELFLTENEYAAERLADLVIDGA